ncbi:MAG: putative lipopolysaccharide heptosyltransferase III [Candidatus Desulfofervidaceae bacterium]|nr:putative lipopolysaccharide heptosyltransferase III [Candidatus Desulfofervidaceae bacterium]
MKQIGDVLLCEPALRLLKEAYPEAELTVIVNDFTVPMLKNADYIDFLFGYDRSLKRLKFYTRFKKEYDFVRRWQRKSYDIVINFSSGDRGAIYSLLTKAKYKIGRHSSKGFWGKNRVYDIVLSPPATHTVLQDLFLVVKGLNLSYVSPRVNLYLSQDEIARMKTKLKKLGVQEGDKIVCIHPVANWLFKCWRNDYMAKVINWLCLQGTKVILTGGKSKKELCFIQEILKEVHYSVINLAGQLDLEALGAVIWYSDLFFGVDTAPMHMAAALNKPVIALFGPTGMAIWGPWENDLSYTDFASPYKIKGTQTLGKHTVLQKDWDCVPCGKDGCNGSKISKCLHAITPAEVISVLKEKLGG